MKRLLFASTMLVGAALAPAANAVIVLENPGSVQYQQTLNSPCVIGEESCKQPAGFGEGIIPVNQSTYDVTSANYTVTQLLALLAGQTSFTIGIDVNTTTSPLATERLDFFGMYINGVLSAANTYDPASPGTQLRTVNNGNGNSDELLTGFSLAGLSGSTGITFRAVVTDATDGREEFFIVGAATPRVPEPASIALLGMGLLGLGVARRRARVG